MTSGSLFATLSSEDLSSASTNRGKTHRRHGYPCPRRQRPLSHRNLRSSRYLYTTLCNGDKSTPLSDPTSRRYRPINLHVVEVTGQNSFSRRSLRRRCPIVKPHLPRDHMARNASINSGSDNISRRRSTSSNSVSISRRSSGSASAKGLTAPSEYTRNGALKHCSRKLPCSALLLSKFANNSPRARLLRLLTLSIAAKAVTFSGLP